MGVGITYHVQPMLRPAFAITRGSEQAVHRLFRGIRDKPGQFLRGGRQAGEIEGHPAQPNQRIGGGRHREAVFVQLGGDEGIDGRFTRGHGKRLEGPVGARVGQLHFVHPIRPQRPFPDPTRQGRHFGGVQPWPLGRHLRMRVSTGHEADERTLLRFSRHHRGPLLIASFEGRGLYIQPQS